MTPLVALRLALLAAGLTVFALGVRGDNERLRWIGILLLAIVAARRLLRGVTRRRR